MPAAFTLLAAYSPDLFAIFRWLGFVFVTIYVTITTVQSLWGWYRFLWQRDRYIDLLRTYVIVHGLRLRLASFGGDAMVCALLCVAFLLMWRVHIRLNELSVALGRVYEVRHVKWQEPWAEQAATLPTTAPGR